MGTPAISRRLNGPVTFLDPLGEVSGVRLGDILPDQMSAIEERLTTIGQRVHKQLAIRGRNDLVVPSGQNKDRGLDAWQKSLQAREIARVSPNILRRLLEPAAGGR